MIAHNSDRHGHPIPHALEQPSCSDGSVANLRVGELQRIQPVPSTAISTGPLLEIPASATALPNALPRDGAVARMTMARAEPMSRSTPRRLPRPAPGAGRVQGRGRRKVGAEAVQCTRRTPQGRERHHLRRLKTRYRAHVAAAAIDMLVGDDLGERSGR